MVRRLAQVSLAVFLVLALATLASAAPNVGSTSQKGSLLVFPKILNYDANSGGTIGAIDTYIFIGNDNTVGTYVKCYWMDNNQSSEDFHFWVTANQPIVLSAKDSEYGPVFGDNRAGSLVCWAQNPEDTAPVNSNHLYGYAMIVDEATGGAKVFYNATSFAVRGAAFNATSGYLPLDGGTGYDACPKYLITNFIADGTTAFGFSGNAAKPDLTLWPCKQDLRQDRIPTCTKAKFDIWNEGEVKFTGAYQCFKCFFEGFLAEIGTAKTWNYTRGKGFGGEKFTNTVLNSDIGRLRVQGIKSSVCYGNTRATVNGSNYVCKDAEHVNTPLLGVLLYGKSYAAVGDLTNTAIQAFGGYTMHGASYDSDGWIKWDPAGAVESVKK